MHVHIDSATFDLCSIIHAEKPNENFGLSHPIHSSMCIGKIIENSNKTYEIFHIYSFFSVVYSGKNREYLFAICYPHTRTHFQIDNGKTLFSFYACLKYFLVVFVFICNQIYISSSVRATSTPFFNCVAKDGSEHLSERLQFARIVAIIHFTDADQSVYILLSMALEWNVQSLCVKVCVYLVSIGSHCSTSRIIFYTQPNISTRIRNRHTHTHVSVCEFITF